MGAYTLTGGARFTWHGTRYAVARLLPHQRLALTDLGGGVPQIVDEAVLMQAACDGLLTLATQDQLVAPTDPTPAPEPFLDWDDYTPHLRAIAEHRERVIAPLLGGRWSGKAARARVDAVRREWAAGPPPTRTLLRTLSVTSVWRWLTRYTACGHDIRALIPRTQQRGGRGRSRSKDRRVDEIITSVINDVYYKQPYTPIKQLHEEVRARLAAWNAAQPAAPPLSPPSWNTIQRRVAALDPLEKHAAKVGKRAAARHARQVGEAAEPAWPLARVEIDHTLVPVIVLDERDNLPLGLPVLTYCLDVATRYPLGYYLGFEPFSYYAVMECLHHAIRPKDPAVGQRYGCRHAWHAYGIPVELFTDHGKEFTGHALRDACLALDVHLRHTPVRTPEFKGTIERNFQRLEQELFSTLPGAVFEKLQQREGYDAIRNACLSLGDLDRLLYRWMVDVYAQEPHAGLGGDTPANRWQVLTADAFTSAPRAPRDAADLKVLLGRVATRTVQQYGIDFLTLRYNCQELAPLRGKTVKVKYHPGDLSQLHIFDPAAGRYLTVPALAREYTAGLTLWTHRLLKEKRLAERGTVDMAGLREAKAEFQHVIAAAKGRKRLHHRVARARTGGAPAGSLGAAPQQHAPATATPAPQPPATRATEQEEVLEALLAGLTTDAPGWGLSRPSATQQERRGPAGRGPDGGGDR